MDFSCFFENATREVHFPYQRRLAESDTLASLLHAPTGSGKTAAIVIAWLWRRFCASEEVKRVTPRRLVYCLPMRVLVEQTYREAQKWVRAIGLNGRVGVHLLMGGEQAEDWDLYPEREAILIGTQDMLLSRALNRGYGMSRYRWPMPYALLNNDSLWVMDEIQLMGSGLATSTQLQAFREQVCTQGNVQTIWMSATLRREWLKSIDFRERVDRLPLLRLEQEDFDFPQLKERYYAEKPLARAQASADQPEHVALQIKQEHQLGSLTLVIVNTVERGRQLFEALRKLYTPKIRNKGGKRAKSDPAPPPEVQVQNLLLIHSRFRPHERAQQMAQLEAASGKSDLIVIATQVVEAGVDISAKTLFTELAPWPSLVQRFGRCNRRGEFKTDVKVFWIDVPTDDKKNLAPPYSEGELNAARQELEGGLLDVGLARLQTHLDSLPQETQAALFPYEPQHVVRRKDFVELFDTTPDLAGNDVDVSRFIRDGDDLDVQVFWREGDPERGQSRAETRRQAPVREELCSVAFHRFREFLDPKQGKTAWRWDALEAHWVPARADVVFPGQVYWLRSNQGGYSQETGWDGKSGARVNPVPVPGPLPLVEAYEDDQWSQQVWQSIAEHTDEVVAVVRTITDELDLAQEWRHVLAIAARWHDWGKTHPEFQAAIRDEPEGAVQRPTEWRGRRDVGKAPDGFWRRYRRKHLRHELASGLALLQVESPPADLASLDDLLRDLVVYLVAAHHGKVRLSIRSLPDETRPDRTNTRFARGIWDGDELPPTDLGGGKQTGPLKLSLEPIELGLNCQGRPSWLERMLHLRNCQGIGPLRLVFLEALLRAADMRASREAGKRKGGKSDV